MRRRPRAGALAPALVAAALGLAAPVLAPAPALASRTQDSLFEDDAQLVLSGDAARERTLDDLQSLGADTVHSIVFWNRVAPQPTAKRRPAGFDGADPASYPPELWDKYDGLVRGAVARGLDLILSPASPMPAWASGCHASVSVRRTCRPNPTQFKRFVQAIGLRYSGEYRDENQGQTMLPRVSRWSVWNEPNQGGWLTPQYVKQNGAVSPAAPAIYRTLVRAALKGLAASGHTRDQVLLGETAPLGRVTGSLATRPIAPGDFLRGVLCLDGKDRPLRGAAAKAQDCGGFRRLAVTGIAHHPYTRGGSQPPTSRGGPSEITISSVSRLRTIIKAGAAHRRIPFRLPIYYTEFGFQTNPPDTLFGVSLANQAAYLNHSDFLAYEDSSIKAVAQYELRDEKDLGGFQTGLRFLDGTAKPSFAAYRMPIWVSRSGSRLRVWGQVRPAATGTPEAVDVQNDPAGGDDFQTVTTVMSSARRGFVDVKVPKTPGTWRLRWSPSTGGPTITSRTAEPGR
ncbi:hypothetical protein NBH00_16080 [Paraconexibacter antarcticus]|uniref:Glycoside hydrolase family 42 N-terminal domain-containing protein n=1 Tax=Paraconexibacter antarcticus TaxID=2949664 RepID=A0ABY5DQM4_9ACTN|nr:hypothetical protein [Paraconexibacter antarcticus]UTI62874.1 hypothetical protein NBH00_16080 [Paraconexibacter antarcticus]